MKTRHTKEDLIHNIPDYISGRLDNNDLISEIETEIEINPEFKNEFEEMRSTFNFLDSAELETPHENYFNNLSVKINDRISHEVIPVNFWERLKNQWKILIPVIPTVIISIFLLNTYTKDTTDIKITESGKVNTETVKTNKEENITKMHEVQKQDKLTPPVEKLTKKIVKPRSEVFTKKEVTEENLNDINESDVKNETTAENETYGSMLADNSDISDITNNESEEDMLFIKDTEEDNFEEELMELTPEDQKEILENLNKSQI